LIEKWFETQDDISLNEAIIFLSMVGNAYGRKDLVTTFVKRFNISVEDLEK
jgi:hypothetical protein